MNGSRQRFEIDGEKLKKQLKVRGLTNITAVEQECGFGQSTLNKYINKNYITSMPMAVLTAKYNIQLDDILPYDAKVCEEDEKEPQFVVSDEVIDKLVDKLYQKFVTEDTGEKLNKIIYSAVYHAVKQVWAE